MYLVGLVDEFYLYLQSTCGGRNWQFFCLMQTRWWSSSDSPRQMSLVITTYVQYVILCGLEDETQHVAGALMRKAAMMMTGKSLHSRASLVLSCVWIFLYQLCYGRKLMQVSQDKTTSLAYCVTSFIRPIQHPLKWSKEKKVFSPTSERTKTDSTISLPMRINWPPLRLLNYE